MVFINVDTRFVLLILHDQLSGYEFIANGFINNK